MDSEIIHRHQASAELPSHCQKRIHDTTGAGKQKRTTENQSPQRQIVLLPLQVSPLTFHGSKRRVPHPEDSGSVKGSHPGYLASPLLGDTNLICRVYDPTLTSGIDLTNELANSRLTLKGSKIIAPGATRGQQSTGSTTLKGLKKPQSLEPALVKTPHNPPRGLGVGKGIRTPHNPDTSGRGSHPGYWSCP